ncbi:serine hydrolase [Arthrobacter sp.]|uniref:serine hydrolase n=1 Tax=Arthrobacter sp. TaxID=1667 RepID=UPI00289F3EC9|nr:serine hydrolase [Arthrobacter sp.]
MPHPSSGGVVDGVREELAAAGLQASLLVRDLTSGDEISLDADRQFPVASLVKLPLAALVLEQIDDGALDPAMTVGIPPQAASSPGPTGTTRFRHEARIAVEDLVTLAVSLSDSAAADALFTLVDPSQVNAWLARAGLPDIRVRHRLSDLHTTIMEALGPSHERLAHTLAHRGGETEGTHPIPQLDHSRANVGTARAFANLLTEVWRPSWMPGAAAARVRETLHANVHRQRLSPDLASDASRWASKTGTLLNLRHEVGVLENDDGHDYVICVLSESRVPAANQPVADATLGSAARQLRDALR